MEKRYLRVWVLVERGGAGYQLTAGGEPLIAAMAALVAGGGSGRAREGAKWEISPKAPLLVAVGSSTSSKDKASTGNNGVSSGNIPASGL